MLESQPTKKKRPSEKNLRIRPRAEVHKQNGEDKLNRELLEEALVGGVWVGKVGAGRFSTTVITPVSLSERRKTGGLGK